MSQPFSSASRVFSRAIRSSAVHWQSSAGRRALWTARASAPAGARAAWSTSAAVFGVAGLAAMSAWSLRPELVPAFLPVAHAEVLPKEGVYVDPTTLTPFSSKIVNPHGQVLQLVGSGVRTVSFLAVRVYCAGMYIAEDAVQRIKKGTLPGWEGYTASRLLPPFTSEGGPIVGEALLARLLDEKYDVAVTIVPLRNTSLSHLRDAFSRALVARLKLPHVAGAMSPEEVEAASMHLSELRTLFPGKTLDKGSPMVCHFFDGGVRFELQDPKDHSKIEILGTLRNPILARQLFLSYLSDTGSISEELRKSVAGGFDGEAR